MKFDLALPVLASMAAALATPAIFRKSIGDFCSADEGDGDCRSTADCKGISYPKNLCPNDPNDVQCCVEITCTAGGGSGYCRSVSNNGCSGGDFHPGTSAPWPCPGDSDIQCCIPSSDSSDSNPDPDTGNSDSGKLPGLNTKQSGYARTIAKAGKDAGLPKGACVVAIATALVESSIKVYANSNVPESLDIAHDDVGSDHLSVGIFQQQTPMWGTAADCMEPATSAGKFYDALERVDGWEDMSAGVAAQKVQRSAYPDRYAERVEEASAACDAAW